MSKICGQTCGCKDSSQCQFNRLSNRSVKSPEEVLKNKLRDIHFIDSDATYALVLESMQSYSNQNLTEYKRRLKEEIDRWHDIDPEFDMDIYIQITRLVNLDLK